jgi:hypothetical protein
MDVHYDRPPVFWLQPSTHPSFRVGNKSKNRETENACVCSDDDDPDSLCADDLEMGQGSGTSWRRTARARQDSASQNLDSSKKLMFNGWVATLNPCGVEWDQDNDPVPLEIRDDAEKLKASFSKNASAEIQYTVIVSDRETRAYRHGTLKNL